MNSAMKRLVASTVCLQLSACAGLTQMQDSLNKFGAGATSVSTTEMTFFNNVQSLDCSVQFYGQATDWAIGKTGNYDISGACTPAIITTDQLAIRQHILDAITAYAGKMQALACATGDQTLDANGRSVANQINTLATRPGGITKADATIASGVEAALIQLANMALDEARFKDAKKAASAMEPSLEVVINELKTENTAFAASIVSQRGKLELTLRKVVDSVPPSDQALRLSAVIDARNIMRSANPFGQEALSTASGIPTPDASKLNSALDGVLSANQAIASASKGGIVAAATDLVSRAQAAQTDETAITK